VVRDASDRSADAFGLAKLSLVDAAGRFARLQRSQTRVHRPARREPKLERRKRQLQRCLDDTSSVVARQLHDTNGGSEHAHGRTVAARRPRPGAAAMMRGVPAVLVVNAGSTSLKLDVVGDDDTTTRIASLDEAGAVGAVGHRIVHGGARFLEPVVLSPEVKDEIAELSVLAPLHNRVALDAVEQAERALPDVPHVAVFDTSFHRSMPQEATTYALPRRWREELGVRRYGFHGLSIAWSAERVPVSRLVVCHLGGGCSITAVADGRSVATTMGFSPLEGVPMATRAGSVDPGALLYLLREGLVSVEEMDHALEYESGLAALGGLENPLAFSVYANRIAGSIASMAASLDGLDAIVFTAGVGENVPAVRAEVCRRLAFLGVELDPDLNDAAEPDADVAAASSQARVVVVHAREELMVARAVRNLCRA